MRFWRPDLAVAGGGLGDDFGGEAGEVAPVVAVGGCEDEGDEAGAGFDEGVAEAGGDLVTDAGGAHLGDGEAAGGDDDGLRGEGACGGFDRETGAGRGCGFHGEDADAGAEVDRRFSALAFEEGDDALGGVVAEELAEGLLVVADVVLFDQRDDVGGGEAGQRGAGEVRVGGEEVFSGGVDVGEVAAAASGDEDFAAGALAVLEQKDAATAAAGFEGAHHARGAGAEDDDVEVSGSGRHLKIFYGAVWGA